MNQLTLPESEISKPTTSAQYRIISASLSFIVWGGWSWFVNSQAHVEHAALPIVSGLIQGTGSCLVTLFMMESVTRLYGKFLKHPLRFLLPTILTTMMTGTFFTLLHLLVRTADPVLTVLPGLVVAFFFNLYTTYRLRQVHLQTSTQRKQVG